MTKNKCGGHVACLYDVRNSVRMFQVSMYDKRGEERADSAEFLKDFWQIGRDGRERQARKRAQMARKLNVRFADGLDDL